MKIITLNSKLTRLESADNYVFRGYASVFDNINSYGFSVKPGAFDHVLEEGQTPAMFFNHDADAVPIGIWRALSVDDYGLKVEGQLTEGIQLADDVYRAIKHGSVNGMSIGFDCKPSGIDEKSGAILSIDHLYEISVCTFPADGKARISEALSAELENRIANCASIEDFEDCLRDAGGFSRTRAKQLIARMKQVFADQRDAEAVEAENSRLAAEIEKLAAKHISF